MLIDFTAIPEKIMNNMRGGEKEVAMRIYDDGLCKILNGKLIPGASIGLHTHENDSETIYILSGTGKVLCDGVYEPLKPGDVHYCPMGHAHSLINDGEENLEVLGIIPEHGAANNT